MDEISTTAGARGTALLPLAPGAVRCESPIARRNRPFSATSDSANIGNQRRKRSFKEVAAARTIANDTVLTGYLWQDADTAARHVPVK